MGLLDKWKNKQIEAELENVKKYLTKLTCESEVTGEKIDFIVMDKEKEKVKQFFQNIEDKYKNDIVK